MPTGLLGTYFPGEDPMAPVDLMPRGLLGPSVLGRMQAHGDAQRQRMAAGDYSPTPMNEESMWLADDLAGGLLGSLPGGVMGAIKAYHGSPHRFDRFDMSKIGTGEGAQAYGHGLYMAESPEVARSYADMAPRSGKMSERLAWANLDNFGRERGIRELEADAARTNAYMTPERQREHREAAELLRSGWEPQKGALYTTRLDVEPEDLLDWDAPLSQQSEKVRAALMAAIDARRGPSEAQMFPLNPKKLTGEQAYRMLHPESRYNSEAASSILREAGIPGIRYLDQGSRASREGTRNFVIFDDKLIDIEGVE